MCIRDSLETVRPGVTGVFFGQQTTQSLERAIGVFEGQARDFDAAVIRRHAETFRPERFREAFQTILTAAEEARQRGQDPERAVMALP